LTTNGGGWPRWRGDGEELFYVEADGTLMSISLSYSGDGSSFTASNPVKLFTAPINSSPVNTGAGPQFAVTPDGLRFLVVTSPEVESPVYLHGAERCDAAAGGSHVAAQALRRWTSLRATR
jgi:hypothetical protein